MSAIQKGDLVMVVRPSRCTGGTDGIGHVFRVLRIMNSGYCAYCLRIHRGGDGGEFLGADDGAHLWALYRLKKIDPPAIDESIDQREGITA